MGSENVQDNIEMHLPTFKDEPTLDQNIHDDIEKHLSTFKDEPTFEDQEMQSFLRFYFAGKQSSSGSGNVNLFTSSSVLDYDEHSGAEQSDISTDSCSTQSPLTLQDMVDFSEWAKFNLEFGFWDNDDLEEVRPRRFSELKLNEKERSGLLTRKMVASALSHLVHLPDFTHYTFTKLQLINKGLVDITVLGNYNNLMYIDLSENNIEDMRIFCNMPYLIYLNLRQNNITDLDVEETKPLFLTHLNVSCNHIEEIPWLDSLWSLTHLDLSHNYILSTRGLLSLRYLEYLNLSYNSIEMLSLNLFEMNLRVLDLSHNKIFTFSSNEMKHLTISQTLQQLILSHNLLTSIEHLQVLYWLDKLDISFNNIIEMKELNYLRCMKQLKTLIIEGNTVWNLTDCRGLIIHLVPSIGEINSLPVTLMERCHAADLYSKSLLSKAFRTYSWILAKRYSAGPQFQGINPALKVYSNEIVVLVGPPGSNKWKMVQDLCNKYPQFLRRGALVTTRNIWGNTMESVSIDEFTDLINSGRTVTHEFNNDAGYALCWDELKRDGRVILIGLELCSALCLVWQGLAPTLILTLTENIDLHVERLKVLKSITSDVRSFNEEFPSETQISIDNKAASDHSLIFTQDSRSTLSQDEFPESQGSRKDSNTSNTSITIISEDKFNASTTDAEQKNIEESSHQPKYINESQGFIHESQGYYKIPSEISHSKSNTTFHELYDPNEFLSMICNLLGQISQYTADIIKTDKKQADSKESSCHSKEKEEEEEVVVVSEKETATDRIIKYLINSVVESRKEYMQINNNMPGLFRAVITTDDVELAKKKIFKIITEVHNNLAHGSYNPANYILKDDPLYDSIVSKNKENILKKLHHKSFCPSKIPENNKNIPPNENCFYFCK